MGIVMIKAVLLCCCLAGMLAGQQPPAADAPEPAPAQLSKVQVVYLFPMRNGLDQYLTNRLTKEGVCRVVVDPHKADAVFTDHVNATFLDKLEELYPSAESLAKKLAGEEKKKAKPEETKDLLIDTEPPTRRDSLFGGGRGNVFLLNPRTRQVLWSIYERPKSLSSDDLDKSAGRIVDRLKKRLRPE